MIGGGDHESLVGRATFVSPAMAHAAVQTLHGIDMRSDSEKQGSQSIDVVFKADSGCAHFIWYARETKCRSVDIWLRFNALIGHLNRIALSL